MNRNLYIYILYTVCPFELHNYVMEINSYNNIFYYVINAKPNQLFMFYKIINRYYTIL